MSTNDLFYQQIASLHADLSQDQHARLDVFLQQYGALQHYKEMVAPAIPNPDEEQRDQDSAMRAFVIYELVPEKDWDEFFKILGPDLEPRFDEAMEKVKARFAALGLA